MLGNRTVKVECPSSLKRQKLAELTSKIIYFYGPKGRMSAQLAVGTRGGLVVA